MVSSMEKEHKTFTIITKTKITNFKIYRTHNLTCVKLLHTKALGMRVILYRIQSKVKAYSLMLVQTRTII